MSKEEKQFLQKKKRQKRTILLIQLSMVILFFLTWEILAKQKIINPFIFSSPTKIYNTLITLIKTGEIASHIFTTLYEIVLAFSIGISLGFIIAIILYEFPTLAKIIDPFLTMLNSLPKVALGPMIIIWVGANTKAIIFMALLINLIVSIMNIYNGFQGTDQNKIKLLISFGANKYQILKHLIIPESKRTIIASLKINISMTLIGVIMGEFLVSKKGIGYLIIYGTQVFNLSLVMTGIFLLIIISFLLYKIITFIEKKLTVNQK